MNVTQHIPERIKWLLRAGMGRRVRPKSRKRPPSQLWSIGIYEGMSLGHLGPAREAKNPVIQPEDVSDIPARYVADPFMIRWEGMWYMFFEVKNGKRKVGEIGLATSGDGYRWRYDRIVLAEPFHLSYPYVFEWEGHHYMIPETHQTRTVRLYRSSSFPFGWDFMETLMSGPTFQDSSVFWHQDRWWMFSDTSPEIQFDTLRLYHADALLGPWSEHAESPIIRHDPRTARPGGRIVRLGGRLLRFAQDCHPEYGSKVRAFEITELSRDRYREMEDPGGFELGGSGRGWNRAGMHHIDVSEGPNGTLIAAVDGWRDPAPDGGVRPA